MSIVHRGYARKLAIFNQRYSRGTGHLNFLMTIFKLTAYWSMIQVAVQKYTGLVLPLEWGPLGGVAWIIGGYLIGWLDQAVGFWKQESVFGIEEVNPLMKKLVDQVDEIHVHLTKDIRRDII